MIFVLFNLLALSEFVTRIGDRKERVTEVRVRYDPSATHPVNISYQYLRYRTTLIHDLDLRRRRRLPRPPPQARTPSPRHEALPRD